jgi:hypothetical protein
LNGRRLIAAPVSTR